MMQNTTSCIDDTFNHFCNYKPAADFEMSKNLLSKIQLDSQKNDDENHAAIGILLKQYFEKDFDAEEWAMLAEKVRLYAGLPVTPKPSQEKEPVADHVKQWELMLELAGRVYLLKNSAVPAPKALDSNNNGPVMFAGVGQQVVDPDLAETFFSADDPKGKKKVVTNNGQVGW